MATSRATSGRWLFGPIPDLLLGCGGLYALVLLVFAVGGSELRASEAAWIGPLLVLLLGAPHYGATLLRVYEQRSDRRAYALFAVWATAAVAVAFVASLFDWTVASWLVTIYLTWSPWHYTGQNYGLAVLFLRRRGVTPTPAARRALYGSFVLSYGLTFLVFHGDVASAPSPEFSSGPASLFVSLGIPAAFTAVVFPLLLAAYLLSLVVTGAILARGRSLADLLPSAVMVLSQALWFSIPVALRHWRVSVGVEPFQWELRSYYFFWIGLGHATQYLWITTYYARESTGWKGYGSYLLKILLAGTAIWTLPVILLDPNRVGILPNSTALALLAASAVNIHHFILDGAIWKLRQSRVADVLIRRRAAEEAAPVEPGALGAWQRRAVWGVCATGFALAGFNYLHHSLLLPRALERRDLEAARAIVERVSWLSYVSDEARANLEAAVTQRPGRDPAVALAARRARQHAGRGDWDAARQAYLEALRAAPGDPALLRGLAEAWLELGEPARAVAIYERLVALWPQDTLARRELDAAKRALAQPARE